MWRNCVTVFTDRVPPIKCKMKVPSVISTPATYPATLTATVMVGSLIALLPWWLKVWNVPTMAICVWWNLVTVLELV